MAVLGNIHRKETPESPAKFAVAVTPSNSVDFAEGPCKSLWVGGAGVLIVEMLDGAQITFSGVPAGTIMPIQCRRVHLTGTTATLIVALY
jgi:hypothetical protein